MNQMLANQLPIMIVFRLRHVYLDVFHVVRERRRSFDPQRDVGMGQPAVLKLHSAQIVCTAAMPFRDCFEKAFKLCSTAVQPY